MIIAARIPIAANIDAKPKIVAVFPRILMLRLIARVVDMFRSQSDLQEIYTGAFILSTKTRIPRIRVRIRGSHREHYAKVGPKSRAWP